jgi:phytoene dehydrogenase-like protein
MPTNSYDLIVVGDDFAGLVAGTLCARRGMRVLVLSQGGSASAYSLGPHRLPVEPLCLAGLGSPLVQRVLDELQLGHTLRRKLVQRPVSFQVAAPTCAWTWPRTSIISPPSSCASCPTR